MNTKKKSYNEAKTTISHHIVTKTFDAKTLAKIIQGHWGIENRVNYVKDMTFNEDKSRIRVKPGIFARLRSIVLNIFRINNVENISQSRFVNCCNINYALHYKGIA
jgi:predicted transposase YbfD/YdcC